jgi:hypothetical protein
MVIFGTESTETLVEFPTVWFPKSSKNHPKSSKISIFRSEKCEAILLGRPYQCPDPQMHLAGNGWAVP